MHSICKPFQVNFHVLPFKTFNYLSFCAIVLAHGDVVVGIAIFHIKLSTPRLGSFICSSLILQGSWSDHYNLILKRKKGALLQRNVKVGGHPMESVSHGLRKEKGGEECQSFRKEHHVPNFKELGTAVTCLLWKIVSPHC
jgi:hypothetical protein